MKEALKATARRSRSPEYKTYFTGTGLDINYDTSDALANSITNLYSAKDCRYYDLSANNPELCQNVLDCSVDYLHSSHVLEHLGDIRRAITNWIRVVKVGGYLVIVVPDEHMYEKDKWPSNMNTSHKWSFKFGSEGYANPSRESSIDTLLWFNTFTNVSVVSVKRLSEWYYETEEDLTHRTDVSIECGLEIVLKKVSHIGYKPVNRWNLNGFCFMLNSLAMGDVIAAAPVVKYIVENYYTDPSTYKVVAKEMFRSLFWFIPDSNFRNFEDKTNDWDIPKTWSIGVLNQKKNTDGTTRNTPKAIHLGQFAAFKLVDKLLDKSLLNYVSLPTVDVSSYNVDFSKAVIIVSSYRDSSRMWKAEYILETAKWITSQGLIPVFIGKTDMNMDTHLIPKTSLPADVSAYGTDLRNKTTIPELATILGLAKAVIGLDSGPIHLAGTTSVPIVCGYTSVSAEFRIPIRENGVTYPVVASHLACNHCESNWTSSFWNYEDCYLGTNDCCEHMSADRFIECLKQILNVSE